MSHRADQFVSALTSLDETGDEGPIVQLFADGAELRRPELPSDVPEAPNLFWATYRRQFTRLVTSFTQVHEAGDLSVLEWTSEGELTTGRPIHYAGVSVLTFDRSERITRFVTYYDTAAFTAPPDAHT